MRLSTEQTRQITRTVSQLTGGSADVYVFGSRHAIAGKPALTGESMVILNPASGAANVGAGLPAIPRTVAKQGCIAAN